ncbi:ESX secretion-associated protein EspG [Gordonia tangerina]|uniref:ESX secretion-associated protein EspG n=1 Tax=Gordonia tangerina TaxID=2911060 RepID=A0ABS9DPX7_9ACTN|nr:ESX secretion-associated protein EspG [Gordonia tangerina]MCF3940275.1 ESX secretion-associated protein EspG [Gordonia tangerina]
MWQISADAPAARLDLDVLRRLGEYSDVQTWPVVLDLWPTHADGDDLDAIRAAADREIAQRGLIDAGEPVAWLATALRVLRTPERQLEIRTMGTGAAEIRRTCVARSGHDHVIARRAGEQVDLRLVSVTGESEVGSLVARELDVVEPLEFGGLSAPATELTERLTDCHGANDIADALHALGAVGSDAVVLASALTCCHTRSEIVAVSWSSSGSTQSCGALAIFDTDRGRVVASPSKSPDGRVWTTLSPGGAHRIAQAVGLLIETLPDGRWMP